MDETNLKVDFSGKMAGMVWPAHAVARKRLSSRKFIYRLWWFDNLQIRFGIDQDHLPNS